MNHVRLRRCRLPRCDRPAIPSIAFVPTRSDRWLRHRYVLRLTILGEMRWRCLLMEALLVRWRQLMCLPLSLDRCIRGSDVQPGQSLLQFPSRAHWPWRCVGHDRISRWGWSYSWWRSVIETFNAWQPCHLTCCLVLGKCWSRFVGRLVIRQTARGRSLSVLRIRAGMPGTPPVLHLTFGLASPMGEH